MSDLAPFALPAHVQARVTAGGDRMRTCLRCERIADWCRKNGHPVPAVYEARQWSHSGIVYWSGLCGRCGDIERQERAGRRAKLEGP